MALLGYAKTVSVILYDKCKTIVVITLRLLLFLIQIPNVGNFK